MKCKGITDPSKCLVCKYPDCITDEYGNLPQEAVDKIERNRQRCKEYYALHREELIARRNTPEAKKRKYENTLRWRANNHDKLLKALKKYHKKHREERRQKAAAYYQANRDEICAKAREKYWRGKCANTSKKSDV